MLGLLGLRIFEACRDSAQWKGGEALFLRCNLWREAAENLAESDCHAVLASSYPGG